MYDIDSFNVLLLNKMNILGYVYNGVEKFT